MLVVDASSAQDYERLRSRPAALVVVASSAELETQQLERRVGSEAIVLKPLRRDALYEALAAALGVAPSAANAAAILATQTTAVGGHILLVEDEPVNAAVAQGYLMTLGCTSVWVKDGPEAVARHAAERFDLILMDLSMPTMDGFATTALIRERGGRRIPIIAMTAHDAANYQETCLQAGMDEMLCKPCTLEECARVLRRWIPATVSHVDAAAVARLRGLRGGGQSDLYSKLVDLFRTGSSEALTQLQTALRCADLKAAAAVCHKLASSAANVGALDFAKVVRQLELSCTAGETEAVEPLLDTLRTTHSPLLDELLELKLRATA